MQPSNYSIVCDLKPTEKQYPPADPWILWIWDKILNKCSRTNERINVYKRKQNGAKKESTNSSTTFMNSST